MKKKLLLLNFIYPIVLKPGPAGRSGTRGLEPGRVEEKKGGKKIRCDPESWPGDPVDQVKNLVATRWFFFLLKRRRFDFKKK